MPLGFSVDAAALRSTSLSLSTVSSDSDSISAKRRGAEKHVSSIYPSKRSQSIGTQDLIDNALRARPLASKKLHREAWLEEHEIDAHGMSSLREVEVEKRRRYEEERAERQRRKQQEDKEEEERRRRRREEEEAWDEEVRRLRKEEEKHDEEGRRRKKEEAIEDERRRRRREEEAAAEEERRRRREEEAKEEERRRRRREEEAAEEERRRRQLDEEAAEEERRRRRRLEEDARRRDEEEQRSVERLRKTQEEEHRLRQLHDQDARDDEDALRRRREREEEEAEWRRKQEQRRREQEEEEWKRRREAQRKEWEREEAEWRRRKAEMEQQLQQTPTKATIPLSYPSSPVDDDTATARPDDTVVPGFAPSPLDAHKVKAPPAPPPPRIVKVVDTEEMLHMQRRYEEELRRQKDELEAKHREEIMRLRRQQNSTPPPQPHHDTTGRQFEASLHHPPHRPLPPGPHPSSPSKLSPLRPEHPAHPPVAQYQPPYPPPPPLHPVASDMSNTDLLQTEWSALPAHHREGPRRGHSPSASNTSLNRSKSPLVSPSRTHTLSPASFPQFRDCGSPTNTPPDISCIPHPDRTVFMSSSELQPPLYRPPSVTKRSRSNPVRASEFHCPSTRSASGGGVSSSPSQGQSPRRALRVAVQSHHRGGSPSLPQPPLTPSRPYSQIHRGRSSIIHQTDIECMAQEASFVANKKPSEQPARVDRFEALYAHSKMKDERLQQNKDAIDAEKMVECTFRPRTTKLPTMSGPPPSVTPTNASKLRRNKVLEEKLERGPVNSPQISPPRPESSMSEDRSRSRSPRISTRERQARQALKECTFHPLTNANKLPTREPPTKPIKGYQQAVRRVRDAKEVKRAQQEPKALGSSWTGEPTVPKPFVFELQNRRGASRKAPILYIDVTIGRNKHASGRIGVHEGDDPVQLVDSFAKIHRLDDKQRERLYLTVREAMATHIQSCGGRDDPF